MWRDLDALMGSEALWAPVNPQRISFRLPAATDGNQIVAERLHTQVEQGAKAVVAADLAAGNRLNGQALTSAPVPVGSLHGLSSSRHAQAKLSLESVFIRG